MLLLIASASLAATVNVGNGQSLYQACLDADDGDTIVVDTGRSLQGGAEDNCLLDQRSNITLKSSGSASVVGGLFVQDSQDIVLENLKATGTIIPYYFGTVTLLDNDRVTIKNVEISGRSDWDVYRLYGINVSELKIDGLNATGMPAGEVFVYLFTDGSVGSTNLELGGLQATGQGARVELQLSSNVSADIDDLVLDGGQGDLGGCLYSTGAEVSLKDPILTGCSANLGGAAYLESGSLNIRGGLLQSNEAVSGGGAYVGSAGELHLADDVQVLGNLASSGSAVYIDRGRLSANGAFVVDNASVPWSGGPPTSGAIEAFEPELLDLRATRFCGNSVTGDKGGVGSVLTLRGAGASAPSLSFSELRNNLGGEAVLFIDDHDLVKLQNLSVIGNDAETLIRTNGPFLLDSSLMSDAAVGHDYAGTPGTGYNYWFQVDDPAPMGSVHGQDFQSDVDPGFAADVDTSDCFSPLLLSSTSPLIDQGNPTKALDADGSFRDIGAWPFGTDPGDTGDSGDSGDPGDTGDSGDSGDTGETGQVGETGLLPTSVLLSGGCGGGGTSGAASMLMGLLLLGFKRRVKSPSGGGASRTP